MRYLLTLIILIGLTRCDADSIVNQETAPTLPATLAKRQKPTVPPASSGLQTPQENGTSTPLKSTGEESRTAPLVLSAKQGGAPTVNGVSNSFINDAISLVSGGAVVTNKMTDLFDRPNGTVIAHVEAGTHGMIYVLRNDWARVDFDSGSSGVVRAGDLDPFMEPPSPPEEPPPSPFIVEAAGFVGCSNTHEKRMGAGAISDTWNAKFWPEDITRDIGHGTLGEWGVPTSIHYAELWGVIERGFAAMPETNTIIWEVCIGRRDEQPDEPTPNDLELGWAEAVLTRLQIEHPGVTIFVSGLNTYDGFDCKLTGTNGPARAQAVADYLVGLGAAPGVAWGPLSLTDVESDQCHLSEQGEALTGGQLITYIEALETG